MRIGRSLCQRALGQLSAPVPAAGLDERERMHGREPPVVAVVGGERFEECEQLGFPADTAAEADGTEHAACGGQGERVAGVVDDVPPDEVECRRNLAGHEQADNLDVLLFPRGATVAQPDSSLRAGLSFGRPHVELMVAGHGGMREGKPRISVDRRRQALFDPRIGGEHPIDALDIGVTSGGGRGAELEAVAIFHALRLQRAVCPRLLRPPPATRRGEDRIRARSTGHLRIPATPRRCRCRRGRRPRWPGRRSGREN